MFAEEQKEYTKEGINWSNIKFKDNDQTIELIEHVSQPSIFKMLDEQFMLGTRGNDEGFFRSMTTMLRNHKSFKGPQKIGQQQFCICHFAGDVTYDVDGFVEKNKDSVSEIITECLAASSHALFKTIYSDKVAIFETTQSKSIKGNTLSAQFKTQLNQLIVTLSKSQPRYVRCIKPNSKFSPAAFESKDVCT